MKDYSPKLLELNRLIKQFHNATLKSNWVRAYEIACDITEVAQEMEDVAQEIVKMTTMTEHTHLDMGYKKEMK